MSRPPLSARFTNWFTNNVNQLGDSWNNIIGPSEGLVSNLFNRFLSIFDSFDALEAMVLRLVSILLKPFALVGKKVARYLPTGVTESQWFTLPSRIFITIVLAMFWLAEKLNLDGVLFFFLWMLKPIWWPIAMVLEFANAWLATRSARELTLSVPALLLAAPFAYVAIAGASQSQVETAERYKIAVRDALLAGNEADAQLFERKLAQLGVDTRKTDFRNAKSIALEGDMGTAYERMKRLASPSSPGYVSAHAWIAQHLLTDKLTAEEEPLLVDESQRLVLAGQHLDQLESFGINGSGVSQMRAFILAKNDRFLEAANLLEPYSDNSRSLASQRLRWLVTAKASEDAIQQARELLPMFSRSTSNAKPLSKEEHQTLIMAAELVGDNQRLESALLAWRDADMEDLRPQEMLGALRRRQVEKLLATQTSNPGRVIQQLIEAIQLGCSRQWLLKQTEKIAEQRAKLHSAQLIWDGLKDSSDASDELLEAIATTAASQGQISEARQIYKRLTEEGVDRASVWNNYAWALIQDPNPNPKSALVAANRALDLKPKDYRFRETRGQVQIQLQRWQAAIKDLEYALNGMPESVEIHSSLATAYEAIQDLRLARVHYQLAKP